MEYYESDEILIKEAYEKYISTKVLPKNKFIQGKSDPYPMLDLAKIVLNIERREKIKKLNKAAAAETIILTNMNWLIDSR